jgi:glutamate-ammonia-ligase adenylyltransferase
MKSLPERWLWRTVPLPSDRALAQVGRVRWLEALSDGVHADPDASAQVARLFEDTSPEASSIRGRVDAIFGNSPFLTQMTEAEPIFAWDLFRGGPDQALARIGADLANVRQSAIAGTSPEADLRIAKRRLALTVAVADITGSWSLGQVLSALSDFADTALQIACAFLLKNLAQRGAIEMADPLDPERGSGLIVLGLGKLGGRELNYSSDVDLIVFFDPDQVKGPSRDDVQSLFIRLTRALARLMADRTAEGYVFRVDLRLRPDPASTPPAMSILAAEEYYETFGQNWERAALIKARPVAGDIVAADRFLRHLMPYIWRRNLDFAAIQDIHSIKRQINAHRGGGRIGVLGHNVKLGRGGIREIEFFAQTQQLIWGGRLPELRPRATCDALSALARHRKIDEKTKRDLCRCYEFLRRVEHRLQMIGDEQTHQIPSDRIRLAGLSVFLGYPDVETFERELVAVLKTVEEHYSRLFEDSPSLGLDDRPGGNLVFTGGEPDPETRRTLERLGFANPAAVDSSVRGWHHGRCRAMRSVRARELLTELMPVLLKAIARTPDPDAAFVAFDAFLTALPAGVQLFAMFHANPQLLDLVVEVLGAAPRLAEQLARRPSLLESVLAGDFFDRPPSLSSLVKEHAATLARARDFEDVLDRSRRWANERKFQVGVQCLRGLLETQAAQTAWSNVAEAAVAGILPMVEEVFIAQHGRIAGSALVILALGKLGGREMTATSDLDLIFVYGHCDAHRLSDGNRPLPASQYFARLSQKLINALTAPTSEGRLYEVDMRLRPSGMAGPIATSIESFQRYQSEDAWTWEQMALTRARPVAGPAELRRELEVGILRALCRPRERTALASDVVDMRLRMVRERPSPLPLDVKHIRGGMIDVEFIAQFLMLLHARDHPDVLSSSTAEALRRLASAHLLDAGTAQDLLDALDVWQSLQAGLRLTISGPISDPKQSETDQALLARVVKGVTKLDLDVLYDKIASKAEIVHGHFRRILENS